MLFTEYLESLIDYTDINSRQREINGNPDDLSKFNGKRGIPGQLCSTDLISMKSEISVKQECIKLEILKFDVEF